MSKRDLRKELETFDKKKHVNLISELYDLNKEVKEFLDYYIQPKEKEILEKYRSKVEEAFYPKRGYKLQLSVGKKAISDFKKFKPSVDSIIDLMMSYVEFGVEYTNDFGDIDEGFYSSLESVFRDALKQINDYGFHDNFKSRAEEILRKTGDIGWGFHDAIWDIYYETYD